MVRLEILDLRASRDHYGANCIDGHDDSSVLRNRAKPNRHKHIIDDYRFLYCGNAYFKI
ncbi:MAG: hypothetical protein AAB691_00200 [Patescibacteria group bacterium]